MTASSKEKARHDFDGRFPYAIKGEFKLCFNYMSYIGSQDSL